jgi:hypothetical protein
MEKRTMTIRSLVLGLALAATFGLGASGARAQIAPDDTGAGIKRGIQEQNNSGQVGTVTLFRRGESTLVVLELHSVPAGRREPAHIHRGQECDSIDPKPAFGLAPVVNGVSRTIVHYPEDKLLSGNYSVNVHVSETNLAHYVACGHLY